MRRAKLLSGTSSFRKSQPRQPAARHNPDWWRKGPSGHRAGSGVQGVWCFGSSLTTLLLLFFHPAGHQLSSQGLELLQTLQNTGAFFFLDQLGGVILEGGCQGIGIPRLEENQIPRRIVMVFGNGVVYTVLVQNPLEIPAAGFLDFHIGCSMCMPL